MSVKTEAVAIITAVKDQQVQAVTTVFDGAISQLNDLTEDTDIAALQTQVSDLTVQVVDLQSKLTAAAEAFEADEVADAAELQGEKDKEVLLELKNTKLQKKIDAIMAALSNEE